MLRYAKSRCLEGIKQGYEHTVFMDTKENRVLCELKGDTDNCSVDVIKYLNTDKANIAVMHGHPEDYPLSYMDVKFLYDYAVGQVIAINERGEFSLMANKYEQPLKNSESRLNRWRIRRKAMRRAKAFNDYSVTSAYDYQDFKQNTLPHLYKNLVNSTLREYAPKMDMRYVSNYTYS